MKTLKMTVESKYNHLNILCKAIRAVCGTVVKDETLLYNLELCLSEAASNVIEHAYHNMPGNYFDIIIGLEENVIAFTLTDEGDKMPVNRNKKTKLEEAKNIYSIPESGYGLFLINELMDEIFRQEKDGKNILTLKKNIIHV